MKRIVFVAVFATLVTTGLCDDPPHPAPRLAAALQAAFPSPSGTVQPSATMARLNEKGQIVLAFWTYEPVEITATRVLREGKEVKEKHTFYETVTRRDDQVYDPKDIKLFGSDGKPLNKEMLQELLQKERPVLYFYGENKIDSSFLKVIKEGTPILQLPQPPGPS